MMVHVTRDRVWHCIFSMFSGNGRCSPGTNARASHGKQLRAASLGARTDSHARLAKLVGQGSFGVSAEALQPGPVFGSPVRASEARLSRPTAFARHMPAIAWSGKE